MNLRTPLTSVYAAACLKKILRIKPAYPHSKKDLETLGQMRETADEAGKAPEIVNPDFKEKARNWLLSEIYERVSENEELGFLGRVSIRKSGESFVIKKYRGN